MADTPDDSLGGLPVALRRLLAEPPVTEKKLLELRALWPGLSGAAAPMADALRLFVITWDPLELHAPRPAAFATANAGPLELVVYVPCWSLDEMAAARETTVAAVLGALAGGAVAVAASVSDEVTSGRYPGLVRRGGAPDLLADPAAGSALGQPGIRGVSPQWDDIGLGAITDVVQQAFGPVDLDRSLVELSAGVVRASCPACAGGRFGFIAELAEARDAMCKRHRGEAEKVIRRRFARAEASNPVGWAAIGEASRRLDLPHLPGGLATKLAGAGEAIYVVQEPDELAARARLVIEAAKWFHGRSEDLAIALGEEPVLAGLLPDWLMNLVLDLGRAGLGSEAVAVAEALARVDPGERAMFEADLAVALAEGGLAEQARDRIAANLGRWPDDLWTRVHAGDALAALGDHENAEAQFLAALEIAEQADDFVGRSDVIERLINLGSSDPRVAGDDAGGRHTGGRETGGSDTRSRNVVRHPRKVPRRAQRKSKRRPR